MIRPSSLLYTLLSAHLAMGQGSSSLGQCLLQAVGNDPSLVAQPLFKGDPKYQFVDVKPYNLDVPVTPVAVTYPKSAEQVSGIVKCASSNNAKVQARSGGHSYANYCIGGKDGAVVIDLKNLQSFSYDEGTTRAKFGSGTLLDKLTKELDAHGRAIAHGTCPQVGLGGHATIGGLGPTSRMWGSTLDHVLSAQVVLADGSIVTASETENPDVFYAIKGAGAGFGVVTEFEMRTQQTPGKMVVYNYGFNWGNATQLANAFIAWQKLITGDAITQERRFASQFIVTPIGAVISGTFFGPMTDFEKLDLSSIFPHADNDTAVELDDWLGVVGNWAEEVGLQLGGGLPAPFYSQNLPFTKGVTVPDSGAQSLFEYIDKAKSSTLVWFLIFDLEGGAINDPPMNATAYAHRDAVFYGQSYGIGIPTLTDATRNFIIGMSDRIKESLPGVTFGAYPGYVDPMLGDRAQEAYWGENLPELMEIKKRRDPKDLFSNPGSVRPAA